MSSDATNYDVNCKQEVLTPEPLKKFLDEIESVCKKHNLSISYTSCDGLMVSDFNASDMGMLKECIFDIKKPINQQG